MASGITSALMWLVFMKILAERRIKIDISDNYKSVIVGELSTPDTV